MCIRDSIDTWNECARYKEDAYLSDKETYQIGFAGLFLNRTNFSGILKAGPIGGKAQTSKYKLDCRFNKERIIQSILDIAAYKNRVGVFNEDAIDFMEKEVKSGSHKPIFVYIDVYKRQQQGRQSIVTFMADIKCGLKPLF